VPKNGQREEYSVVKSESPPPSSGAESEFMVKLKKTPEPPRSDTAYWKPLQVDKDDGGMMAMWKGLFSRVKLDMRAKSKSKSMMAMWNKEDPDMMGMRSRRRPRSGSWL